MNTSKPRRPKIKEKILYESIPLQAYFEKAYFPF